MLSLIHIKPNLHTYEEGVDLSRHTLHFGKGGGGGEISFSNHEMNQVKLELEAVLFGLKFFHYRTLWKQ